MINKLFANLARLFESYELLLVLTKKELQNKYKFSILGLFWSLLNPIVTAFVFYLVFAVFMKNNIPRFEIFLLSGLLPWNFLSMSVTTAVGSFVANGNLVKKISFPYETLPISSVFSFIVTFVIEIAVFIAFIFITNYQISIWIIILPVVFLAELILSLALALIFSSLNVFFRDIQHFVGLLFLVWFWMNPIIYPISWVSDKISNIFYIIYLLNPMADITILYQQILYHGQQPNWNLLLYGFCSSSILLMLGYVIYLRVKPNLAEEL